MPEHCEVDENGSHGSDVRWRQTTDMLSWVQLSGPAWSMMDYFLQSPQEAMVTSEMRFGLFNVRKNCFFLVGEDSDDLNAVFHVIATVKWARCKVVCGTIPLACSDRGTGTLKNPVNAYTGSCLWLWPVAVVSVWPVIPTLGFIPPSTTIAILTCECPTHNWFLIH